MSLPRPVLGSAGAGIEEKLAPNCALLTSQAEARVRASETQ